MMNLRRVLCKLRKLRKVTFLLFGDILPASSKRTILGILFKGISLSCVEIVFLFSLSNFFQKIGDRNFDLFIAISLTIVLVLLKYFLNVYYQFSTLKYLTELKLKLESKLLSQFNNSILHDALSLSQGTFLHTLRVSVTTITIGGGISLFSLIIDSAMLLTLAAFIAIQFGSGFFLLSIIMVLVVQVVNFAVITPKYSENAGKVNSHGREIFSLIGEFFNGIREIRVFQLQDRFFEEFKKVSQRENISIVKRNLYTDLPRLNFELIFILTLVLGISLSENLPAQISIYELSLVAYSMLRLVPILGRINSNIGSLVGIRDPLSKIDQIIGSLPAMRQTATKSNEPKFVGIRTLDVNGFDVFIGGKNIRFVQDMSFTIGEPVVVTGKSGVGKSTLLNTLTGLMDAENCDLRLNGNGVSRELLKVHTALVTQTPTFFHGTVLENMLYATDGNDFMLEDFEKYSRRLGLWGEIPDLLNSFVGMQDGLSGGQLQRLAVIRALISKRQILLFDESTSAQDQHNSENIINLLFEEAESRIIIFATHRQELVSAFPKHLDLNLLTERPF